MTTPREAILQRLAELLAAPAADGFFPDAAIDEPAPTNWTPVAASGEGERKILHAVAVQDGPPPDRLAQVHGADDADTEELELEAAIAYGVRVEGGMGDTPEQIRSARRARRDAAVPVIAALIAADRTLGLGAEVYAELGPAARDDDVALPNAPACATVVVPIIVLYTAAHAAA